MKKIFFLVAMVAFLGVTIEAQAQEFRGSAGLEIALPMGDFGDAYTLGYGLSVGGELPVGDNLGVTATVGYLLLSVDSELKDFVKSSAMIPAQLGLKYYFDEQQTGAYAHGQIGVHSNSTTFEDTEDIVVGGITVLEGQEGETESDTNLSWAIGAGYFVNENIDLGLRYNSITSGEDEVDALSYIGVRAAYNF